MTQTPLVLDRLTFSDLFDMFMYLVGQLPTAVALREYSNGSSSDVSGEMTRFNAIGLGN